MKFFSQRKSSRARLVVLGVLLLLVAATLAIPPARIRARNVLWGVAYRAGIMRPDLKAAQARLQILLGEGEKLPLESPRIIVHKSERRLALYSGDRFVKEYKIGLGHSPTGHKLRQGGGQTPEGQYYICTRVDPSRIAVFMGINYPNAIDAGLAFDEGIIDQEQHDAIVGAEANRETPPWDTRMGGAIGIHGSGSHADWTLGCIALENKDVEEIWVATRHWTPVEVRP